MWEIQDLLQDLYCLYVLIWQGSGQFNVIQECHKDQIKRYLIFAKNISIVNFNGSAKGRTVFLRQLKQKDW